VDVNKEGTKAAAVTTVSQAMFCAKTPPKPFEMVVNRPFLFVIADEQTQSILFMGIISIRQTDADFKAYSSNFRLYEFPTSQLRPSAISAGSVS